MTKRIIPISGMTCKACEIRVSKGLSTLKGVTVIKVNSRRGEAVIEERAPVKLLSIKNVLEDAGYTYGASRASSWINPDKSVWRDFGVALGVLVVLATLLNITGVAGAVTSFASFDGGTSIASLLLVVVLGAVASVSTCMALVGGIVMSISARYAETHPDVMSKGTFFQKVRPQLLFNLGRIVGFGIFGCSLGLIGSAIPISATFFAVLILVAAIVMAILGVKLTDISPRISKWSVALPAGLTKFMHNADEDDDGKPDHALLHIIQPLGLGAMSFFLPCGFTQAVQIFAISAGSASAVGGGSPLISGLIMALFALGTTPGLFLAGSLSSVPSVFGEHSSKDKTRKIFHIIGVVVLAFSFSNLTGSLAVLAPNFHPVESAISILDGSSAAANSGTISNNVVLTGTGTSAKQVATVKVSDRGYSPATTVVYAGIPVEWHLTGTAYSCASFIAADSLGLDHFSLKDGNNTGSDGVIKRFTLNKKGTYNYSCAMGMYKAKFVAIEGD